LQDIKKNETWDLIKLPEEKNVIGLKWVCRSKYHANGKIQNFKARLVAKGHAQQEGVDFDEIFSPMAHSETVKVFLALAAQLEWPVYQFDVKSAFLNGELKEEVYVAQPEGYVAKGEEDIVYRLKKILYGLKQAPQVWLARLIHIFKRADLK